MLDTQQILLASLVIALSLLFILALIERAVLNKKVLTYSSTSLTPGKTYTAVYRVRPFSNLSFVMEAQPGYISIINEVTYYSGKRTADIEVYDLKSRVLVYKVHLINFKQLYIADEEQE